MINLLYNIFKVLSYGSKQIFCNLIHTMIEQFKNFEQQLFFTVVIIECSSFIF